MNQKKQQKTIKMKEKSFMIKGRKNLIDSDTGEVLESTIIVKNVKKDFNFHKIWLQDLINIIEMLGSKKIKIVNYILNKMSNTDNIVYFTQRQLSKDLNISLPTINDTIKTLLESNFMVKKQNGVYQINPDIIIKGTNDKRTNLLIQYKEIREKTKETEEKKEVKKIIKTMNKKEEENKNRYTNNTKKQEILNIS